MRLLLSFEIESAEPIDGDELCSKLRGETVKRDHVQIVRALEDAIDSLTGSWALINVKTPTFAHAVRDEDTIDE